MRYVGCNHYSLNWAIIQLGTLTCEFVLVVCEGWGTCCEEEKRCMSTFVRILKMHCVGVEEEM